MPMTQIPSVFKKYYYYGYENHFSIIANKIISMTQIPSVFKKYQKMISLNPFLNVSSVIPSKILKMNNYICKKYF